MKVEAAKKPEFKQGKLFTSVTEVSSRTPRPSTNERLDIMGVVNALGNIRVIEHTNKYRMNVEIVDPMTEPYQSIVLCIWEKKGDERSHNSSSKSQGDNADRTVHDEEDKAAAKVVERV